MSVRCRSPSHPSLLLCCTGVPGVALEALCVVLCAPSLWVPSLDFFFPSSPFFVSFFILSRLPAQPYAGSATVLSLSGAQTVVYIGVQNGQVHKATGKWATIRQQTTHNPSHINCTN